jgi:putative transposase
MTSVWVAEHGWTYLMAIIDCCTREIVGWQLELRCRADEAIQVIERAAAVHGIEPGELTLGSDNGSAFTARRFRETLARLGIAHRRGGQSRGVRQTWEDGQRLQKTAAYRVNSGREQVNGRHDTGLARKSDRREAPARMRQPEEGTH